MPADIYNDLLRERKIPDPFDRDNEMSVQWIGATDWSFSRSFEVSSALLARKNVLLRCEGLDTLARITVNGKRIAGSDNMFRTYEWDLRHVLRQGRNTIRISFTSVLPFIAKKNRPFPGWQHFPYVAANPCWVRKEQCNFGWDWAVKAVTCGIWQPINLTLLGHWLVFHNPSITLTTYN